MNPTMAEPATNGDTPTINSEEDNSNISIPEPPLDSNQELPQQSIVVIHSVPLHPPGDSTPEPVMEQNLIHQDSDSSPTQGHSNPEPVMDQGLIHQESASSPPRGGSNPEPVMEHSVIPQDSASSPTQRDSNPEPVMEHSVIPQDSASSPTQEDWNPEPVWDHSLIHQNSACRPIQGNSNTEPVTEHSVIHQDSASTPTQRDSKPEPVMEHSLINQDSASSPTQRDSNPEPVMERSVIHQDSASSPTQRESNPEPVMEHSVIHQDSASSPPQGGSIPEPVMEHSLIQDPTQISYPPEFARPPQVTEPGAEAAPTQKRKRRKREVFSTDALALTGATKTIRALRQAAARGSATYDEELLDQIIQHQLGEGPSSNPSRGRKRKILDMAKEVDTEAMIAHSVGFPPDSLTDEEIEAGVVSSIGGIEQANYIIVRNHILARWRANVATLLHVDNAMESIRSQHRALVNSAYNFLHHHGYINFGVAPAITATGSPTVACNVVVIGAGLAGLAAARQLLNFGLKVAVLESRRRPGGRVLTRRMQGYGHVAAADLGGSVVTGINGNPLGVLARQLGIPLHKVRDRCPLYDTGGRVVDAHVDGRVEEAFNRLLDKACQLRQAMDAATVDISLGTALETFRRAYGVADLEDERRLLDWHLANLEYANAALLSRISLAYWDQDDPYEMGGDHCFLAGGNGRIVQALAEGLPIFYDKKVETIRYGIDGVQVVMGGGQIFQGDMVLCTVPLGVLKNGSVRFEPELPQRKLEAIKRLGFGLLNKVAMLFPSVFWGTEIDTFGHLCEDSSRRGEYFMFYSYASVSGGPLLIALVAGEAAIEFESTPPTEAVDRILEILRGIYGPKGVQVPDPIQTVCTRWGSDPCSFGSYSHVAVGASGDDYDIMAESVGKGRVFFAGEATSRRYPATMHGAFLSGLREAANISKAASSRAMSQKVDRSPMPRDHGESYRALLDDLFGEPDLALGGFSVLFDPQSTDLNSMSLLRVVVGANGRKREENGLPSGQEQQSKFTVGQLQMQSKQQQEQPQQLHLYSLISRQQALELSVISGGDEERLRYLREKLGVRLVGRRGLGALGDAIVNSVKFVRSSQRSGTTSIQFNFGDRGTQV